MPFLSCNVPIQKASYHNPFRCIYELNLPDRKRIFSCITFKLRSTIEWIINVINPSACLLNGTDDTQNDNQFYFKKTIWYSWRFQTEMRIFDRQASSPNSFNWTFFSFWIKKRRKTATQFNMTELELIWISNVPVQWPTRSGTFTALHSLLISHHRNHVFINIVR